MLLDEKSIAVTAASTDEATSPLPSKEFTDKSPGFAGKLKPSQNMINFIPIFARVAPPANETEATRGLPSLNN